MPAPRRRRWGRWQPLPWQRGLFSSLEMKAKKEKSCSSAETKLETSFGSLVRVFLTLLGEKYRYLAKTFEFHSKGKERWHSGGRGLCGDATVKEEEGAWRLVQPPAAAARLADPSVQ